MHVHILNFSACIYRLFSLNLYCFLICDKHFQLDTERMNGSLYSFLHLQQHWLIICITLTLSFSCIKDKTIINQAFPYSFIKYKSSQQTNTGITATFVCAIVENFLWREAINFLLFNIKNFKILTTIKNNTDGSQQCCWSCTPALVQIRDGKSRTTPLFHGGKGIAPWIHEHLLESEGYPSPLLPHQWIQ